MPQKRKADPGLPIVLMLDEPLLFSSPAVPSPKLHSISLWMDIWNSSMALFCSTPSELKQTSRLLGVAGLWKKLKGFMEGVLK